MNADFINSQLRVFAIALIAYLSGRGVFTPADAGLATATLTAFGPMLAPWFASLYVNYGMVKVSTDSKAAAVAAVEKVTDSKEAAIAAVQLLPDKTS